MNPRRGHRASNVRRVNHAYLQSCETRLAAFDSTILISNVKFDWDLVKNPGNQVKHGMSLAEAGVLRQGSVVTLSSRNPGELRHLAIGPIEGKPWTVVYAPRGDHLGLSSARRSRTNEKALFPELIS